MRLRGAMTREEENGKTAKDSAFGFEGAMDMESSAYSDIGGYCGELASTYDLFASLIDREVKEDTAGTVASLATVPGDGDGTDPAGKRVADGFAMMGKAVTYFDEDVEDMLAVDYAHVFLAAGEHNDRCATPYESVYTSEEGILMQDARDDVRRIYRESGVMPDGEGNIPEDYLTLELEYLAGLYRRLGAQLGEGHPEAAGRVAQKAYGFLKGHLLNWVPDLVADIDRVATTDFYHGLALSLDGFLACESDDLPALCAALGTQSAPGASPAARD